MGAFYGSVQVQSEDRESVLGVVNSIAKRKHRFLVSPVLNGWIGIYPNHNGQDDKVGQSVAKRLDGDVIQVVVHDDDVFYYWYYRDGNLVDKLSVPVGAVDFDPNGGYLATASRDGIIRLWQSRDDVTLMISEAEHRLLRFAQNGSKKSAE